MTVSFRARLRRTREIKTTLWTGIGTENKGAAASVGAGGDPPASQWKVGLNSMEHCRLARAMVVIAAAESRHAAAHGHRRHSV